MKCLYVCVGGFVNFLRVLRKTAFFLVFTKEEEKEVENLVFKVVILKIFNILFMVCFFAITSGGISTFNFSQLLLNLYLY